jgi:hypothetical protein
VAITPKSLADGQLPAAKATIYTCPGATTAMIRQIRCSHVSGAATTETVKIFLKVSAGTSRLIGRAMLDQDEQFHVLTDSEALSLEAGDVIEGSTTTATTVDYTITGAEQT